VAPAAAVVAGAADDAIGGADGVGIGVGAADGDGFADGVESLGLGGGVGVAGGGVALGAGALDGGSGLATGPGAAIPWYTAYPVSSTTNVTMKAPSSSSVCRVMRDDRAALLAAHPRWLYSTSRM
jgi:hypothetical protein